MAHAHCIQDKKRLQTHTQISNIYCLSTTTMVTGTRLNITSSAYCLSIFCRATAQQPNTGIGLRIIEVSSSYTIRRAHTHKHTRYDSLCTSDQPVAEAAIYMTHTTNTRDIHPYSLCDSNPHSQQMGGRRPTT